MEVSSMELINIMMISQMRTKPRWPTVGQETYQANVIGSTRSTNGLEGSNHAAAATKIAVPIISLDDARKEYNYYQEVFGSLIEAPNE